LNKTFSFWFYWFLLILVACATLIRLVCCFFILFVLIRLFRAVARLPNPNIIISRADTPPQRRQPPVSVTLLQAPKTRYPLILSTSRHTTLNFGCKGTTFFLLPQENSALFLEKNHFICFLHAGDSKRSEGRF